MNEGIPSPGGTLPPLPIPSGRSFYHQAATCSVWLIAFPFVVQFVSAMAFSGMSKEDAHFANLFFAMIIGLAMLAGIVLGVIALFGIPKYGTKGILLKALFGVFVPVLLILLSIPLIMHAREMATRLQAEQQQSGSP